MNHSFQKATAFPRSLRYFFNMSLGLKLAQNILALWEKHASFASLFKKGLLTDYCLSWNSDELLATLREFAQIVIIIDGSLNLLSEGAGGGTSLRVPVNPSSHTILVAASTCNFSHFSRFLPYYSCVLLKSRLLSAASQHCTQKYDHYQYASKNQLKFTCVLELVFWERLLLCLGDAWNSVRMSPCSIRDRSFFMR